MGKSKKLRITLRNCERKSMKMQAEKEKYSPKEIVSPTECASTFNSVSISPLSQDSSIEHISPTCSGDGHATEESNEQSYSAFNLVQFYDKNPVPGVTLLQNEFVKARRVNSLFLFVVSYY